MRTLALTLCLLATLHGFAQTVVDSFEYDGNVRTYRLHFPNEDSTATDLPLVLNLHGITSNAAEQEFYSNMNPYADTAGYVVCYPNGLLLENDTTGTQREWFVGFLSQQSRTDDAGFLLALVDTLAERYAVDTARVFSTGFSNGGFMSYELACESPGRFAAIASVAGGFVPGRRAACTGDAVVPVMQIHGTDDQTVLFSGRPFVNEPIDTTVAFWTRRNGCTGSPVESGLPDRDPSDAFTSTRVVYDSCSDGARVEYIIVNGGGHSWPGAPVDVAPTTQDFQASREILAFFDRFPRADTTTSTDELGGFRQNPSLLLYPNPTAGTAISTDAADAPRTFRLFNATGQRLSEIQLPAGRTELELGDLPAGNYLLRERSGGNASSWFNVR